MAAEVHSASEPTVGAFATLEGHVEVPRNGGAGRLVIDTIYPEVGGRRQRAVSALSVACPVADLQGWNLQLRAGRGWPLSWEVRQQRTRGFLWWGGRGGEASLQPSPQTSRAECVCKHKQDVATARLYALFLDAEDRPLEALSITGRSERWFLRIFPGLFGGSTPEPPPTVRMALSWRPFPDPSESRIEGAAIPRVSTTGSAK